MRECERERERLQDVVIKMVEEENRIGGNGEGGRERGSGSLKDAERLVVIVYVRAFVRTDLILCTYLSVRTFVRMCF